MRSWLRRVDEEGENALIQASEPVNKFPEFVRYLVKQLKVLLPTMGKVRWIWQRRRDMMRWLRS